MKFKALTQEQCELVRQWRNEDISIYRTPFLITKAMQEDFYNNIICNRNSNHRYWAIWKNEFMGMIGLTDISLENRNAEISIVIDPQQQHKGLGRQAIDMLLDKAFNELNLNSIFAECYEYNSAINFWNKISEKYQIEVTRLPMRKFYKGLYFASYFYTFLKENYEKNI